MFVHQDQQILEKVSNDQLQFYIDAVNSVSFDTPVSYLEKYQIEDYQIIVRTEQEISKLLFTIVSQDIEKPSKISEFLSTQSVDENINPILSKIIGYKIVDIRRALIKRQICRGCPSLLDNNWRIVNVLGTNWSASTNKVLLNLILIIEQNSGKQTEKRINLQLNIHEVEELLNKLKQIKKSLKI